MSFILSLKSYNYKKPACFWIIHHLITVMSNIQMGPYTVGIFLVTLLTTVHCDVIGRTRQPNQGLTPIALSASAFSELTCRYWGKCCEEGNVNCGPQIGRIYCNCDVTCHDYFDCCRDYDEFCTGKSNFCYYCL